MTLQFDDGILASGPPLVHPDYVMHKETNAGFPALMVRPRFPGDRTTGVFFPKELTGSTVTRFNLVGQGLTAEQNDVAFAIFRTLRFKPGN